MTESKQYEVFKKTKEKCITEIMTATERTARTQASLTSFKKQYEVFKKPNSSCQTNKAKPTNVNKLF